MIRTVDKVEERTLEALLLDVAPIDTLVDAVDAAVEEREDVIVVAGRLPENAKVTVFVVVAAAFCEELVHCDVMELRDIGTVAFRGTVDVAITDLTEIALIL